MRGHIIPFNLDTGAEVTAITEQTYNCLGQPKVLLESCMDLPAIPSVSWVNWKRGETVLLLVLSTLSRDSKTIC